MRYRRLREDQLDDSEAVVAGEEAVVSKEGQMLEVTGRVPEYLRRYRFQLAGLSAALAVYALLGFLLAPWLISKNLIEAVRANLDSELSLVQVNINPFVLSLHVEGLEMRDPHGDPLAAVDQIYANFQLSSIFRWALTFDEIRFDGPRLLLDRNEAGELNFAYLFAQPTTEPGKTQPEPASIPRVLIFDFAINDSAIQWQDRLPAEPVATRIGPVNIDIKDFSTLPQRAAQQAVVISTETNGTLSWSGDLQLNPLRSAGHAEIQGSHFGLPSAYLRQSTGFDIVEGHTDMSLDYALEIDANGVFRAAVDQLALSVRDILVRKREALSADDTGSIDHEVLRLPNFTLAGGTLRWPEQKLSAASATIDDAMVSLIRNPQGELNWLTPSGDTAPVNDIEMTPADGPHPGKPWELSLDTLQVSGLAARLLDHSVQPPADVALESLDLTITGISNLNAARFPARATLRTGSGGRIALQGELTGLPQPAADLTINGEAISLAVLHPYIEPLANIKLDEGQLQFAGRLQSSSEEPLALNGNLSVSDFLITESGEGTRLGSWKKLAVTNLAVSAAKETLEISEIYLDNPYADIVVTADGSVNLGRVPKAAQLADGVSTEPPPAEAPTPAASGTDEPAEVSVTIGRVVVANGAADFADFSLPLPFNAKISELDGNISTITTASADASSVDLEGKVDDHGLVRVSGSITPLDPVRNTAVQVAFQNVEMPKFSAYTIPFAGREIASGKLDLNLGYVVQDGKLAGENDIVLRDFELGETVDHPDAMSLPLGLAVALLKDPSGKINIDLPIRGDVNDPEFRYGKVIFSALTNLIVKLVASPFALLGNLIGVEPNELEQINFIAGRADLTPPETERIGKIVEALSLRPELALQIAGVVDRDVDAQALKSARVERQIEAGIAAQGSAGEGMYAARRRAAVEVLYAQAVAGADSKTALAALQEQFTTTVSVDASGTTAAQLDELAYVSEMRAQLVAAQTTSDEELLTLADSRAGNIRAAALALDAALENRIHIDPHQEIQAQPDEAIPVMVTLTADIPTDTQN